MVNRVLMIAYHYPPVRISSGVQRTLAFSKYLSLYGWKPAVLTVNSRAYEHVSNDQMKDIPFDVSVIRAFALDTSRHLAVNGRYFDSMALPDRWISWWLGGVISGLRYIWKYRPKIIWSTYPIATAHLIGLTLSKLTGLPLIADFRDSMTEVDYPRENLRRQIFLWIEKKTVERCKKAFFTTPGAVRMYRERYPDEPDEKWMLLPNGYNEEIFSEVEAGLKLIPSSNIGLPVTLVHSGVIYPIERDPIPFFKALSSLKKNKLIDNHKLKVILRATGHDDLYRPILEKLNIQDIVFLEPGMPYRNALSEMLTADGLLIFQASGCNHQVPAKVYEYFRACRPVLALTDPAGDTASTLIEAGLNNIVPLDNEEAIADGILQFIEELETGCEQNIDKDAIKKYSRQSASEILAKCFDSLNVSMSD